MKFRVTKIEEVKVSSGSIPQIDLRLSLEEVFDDCYSGSPRIAQYPLSIKVPFSPEFGSLTIGAQIVIAPFKETVLSTASLRHVCNDDSCPCRL